MFFTMAQKHAEELRATAEASYAEGYALGIVESGMGTTTEWLERFPKLVERLLMAGRYEQVRQACRDDELREQLFAEYGI